MKGITSIIAIIVLLLITVALAGATWMFLQGFFGTYTEKSFVITTGGAFCTNDGTNNKITVSITNTGTVTLKATDFSILRVDGTDLTVVPSNLTISTRGSGIIINNYDCRNTTGIGCDHGPHSVNIVTTAGGQTTTVMCP